MENKEQLNRTIAEVWNQKYVVPLYQRNFAWGEDQIEQLIQDLYDHSPKQAAENLQLDNYYLGSLVTMLRRDESLEVIDGQQRLTALHILCRKLDILSSPKLSYDSRPEVELFFKTLFLQDWKSAVEWSKRADRTKIARLLDAVKIVDEYRLRTDHGALRLSELAEKYPTEYEMFRDYVLKNVVLICTPLPADSDVAAYFEIMNNRGEQLQAHEILKAELMRPLPDSKRSLLAEIWDGCSQMDIPVQSSLSSLRTIGLFGDNYDQLHTNVIENYCKDGQNSAPKTIDEILADDFTDSIKVDSTNDKEKTERVNRPIIDFPNFLMQTLRLFEKYENKDKETMLTTPLNADAMPMKKPEYIVDPLLFAEFMLRVRVLFDRYVIKSQGGDKDNNADLKWTMLRPYRYENQLRLRNTFSDNSNESDDDSVSDNSRVIKQQSMLQVTFRAQRYKDWLFDLLDWLLHCGTNVSEVSNIEMSTYLDEWIYAYYQKLCCEWSKKAGDLLAAGTDTPRFLFNLVDYLYWVASKQDNAGIRYASEIKKHNFRFKYYNSVEHHLPKSYEKNDGVDVDMIGNLCLVSKSINSSLNKEGPLEKAKVDKNTQPKRRVMYKITNDDEHWGRKQIEDHQKDIVDLLSKCATLLGQTENRELI